MAPDAGAVHDLGVRRGSACDGGHDSEEQELPSPRFHYARSANFAAVAGRASGPGGTHPKLPGTGLC
jgi:hypothetical protein